MVYIRFSPSQCNSWSDSLTPRYRSTHLEGRRDVIFLSDLFPRVSLVRRRAAAVLAIFFTDRPLLHNVGVKTMVLATLNNVAHIYVGVPNWKAVVTLWRFSHQYYYGGP